MSSPSRLSLAAPTSRHRAGAAHEIVSLARGWLAGNAGVFYAPHVPALQEAGARGPHGAYLADSEPVLVLHDATLLGTGENGFFVTPERLCWKNLLEHPRQIAWSEIDPAGIVAQLGSVDIAGGSIAVSGELVSSAARFLTEMASRSRPEPGGPYRRGAYAGESDEGEAHAVARLTTLARSGLGEREHVHYQPAIPPRKLRKARAVHAAHLPLVEEVAVLYDDTLFGGADEGFLVTPHRFCWKNLCGRALSLRWEEILPESVFPNSNIVHLMGGAIHFTARSDLAEPVTELLMTVAREGAGAPPVSAGGAGPPRRLYPLRPRRRRARSAPSSRNLVHP